MTIHIAKHEGTKIFSYENTEFEETCIVRLHDTLYMVADCCGGYDWTLIPVPLDKVKELNKVITEYLKNQTEA